jgi:hypothetical protein
VTSWRTGSVVVSHFTDMHLIRYSPILKKEAGKMSASFEKQILLFTVRF